MINEMSIDAKAGLNAATWRMDQIVRERNEREISAINRQMERFRSFGFDDEQIRARFGNTKYVTAPTGPGEYRVEMEMNGQKMSRTATILKDHWTKD